VTAEPTPATPPPGSPPVPDHQAPSALGVGVVVWLASELMFFAGLFAAYFTLRSVNDVWPPAGVELETARTAVATAVLVGVDPLPGRPPPGARLLALLVAVPFHAVIGLALLTASSPVAPDAYPDLSDQRVAAGLFWGTGELFTLVVAAIIVRQWWVADQRAAAREDRLLAGR